MNIQSINPATGAILENFPETGAGEIERTLAVAYKTFQQWRRSPFAARSKLMRAAARILR